MRVLLVTTGSRGDVEPFVALATALNERGHRATVAAPGRYAGLAAAHQVPYRALDESLLDLQATLASGSALRAISGASRARAAFERFLVDVADLADLPTDVVVHHPKALSAPMVADLQGVPAIAVQLIPLYQPTTKFPAPIISSRVPRILNLATWKLVPLLEAPWRGSLRRLRRDRLGVNTRLMGMSERIARHGALNAWSPHLLPAPREWDKDAAPLGFWRLPTTDWAPPDRLRDFLAAGAPPVYVGFGSMVHQQPEAITEAVTRGLRAARHRGILATGSGALSPIDDDDILVIDQAPHAWLFPRAAAVVHHGGIGTIAAALTAGVPQVIKPFLGDQHFWSRQAHHIGVAVQLETLTPTAVAAAVTQSVTRARHAEALRVLVQQEHALDAAMTRLEQLVPSHP